jgi:hypothetical protein
VKPWLLLLGLLAELGAFGAWHLAQQGQVRAQEQAAAELRAQLASLPEPFDPTDLDPVRERLQAIGALRDRTDAALLELLAAIADDTGVWLTSLELGDEGITMRGRADVVDQVADVERALKEAPCVARTTLGAVERVPTGGHSFALRAAPGEPGSCAGWSGSWPDPFDTPAIEASRQEQQRRALSPASERYRVADFRLIAAFPDQGTALVEAPDGSRVTLQEGVTLGIEQAQVAQVLPDTVTLTRHRLVDRETGAMESEAFVIR